MARDYWFGFGTNPTTNTGLAPTFIFFVNGSGQTQAPPSITETYVGTGLYKSSYTPTQTIAFILDGATTGLATADRYIFGVFDPQDTMGSTLVAVSASLIALGNSNIALGMSNVALGNSNIALGMTNVSIGTTGVGYGASNFLLLNNMGSTVIAIGSTVSGLGISLAGVASLIGSASDSFGSTSADPTTLFGFLRRAQEMAEGNQVYTKATGILQFFSRGSGTSTMLRQKTVTDTTTTTTKE